MPLEGGEAAIRREIVETARKMSRLGLSPGRSGNVSARRGRGALITPSGLAYDVMTPDDVVAIDDAGRAAGGRHAPSSEWRFHLAIYARKPEARAIVHCHSLNATALACARRAIPAFHYMVAVAGGRDIPLAAYATFGSRELSDSIAAALEGRRACLLANHGQVAIGATPAAALDLAQEVETLAAQYILALQAGPPHILDDEEMDRVIEKFRTYGRPASAARQERPAGTQKRK